MVKTPFSLIVGWWSQSVDKKSPLTVKMLSHLIFVLELRIPSHHRLNLVQLLRSCGCFIAHTSRAGRLELLRHTPLSQGCRAQTCPLKMCKLLLIRQCSNNNKQPGWQQFHSASVCVTMLTRIFGSQCESRRWYREFDLWLTRHPTWCLRPES